MLKVLLIALFASVVVHCQDILEEDTDNGLPLEENTAGIEERSEKEKRGIALNLGGTGVEGYSYFGPSSRGLYRGYGSGYTPMTEYGE